jgi:primosomal protein N' (replication factor Y)
MIEARRLLRVAVPVPLAEAFDYLWSQAGPAPAIGCRVRVPFGRREHIGVVLEHPAASELPQHKLKAVAEVLDSEPVLGPELIATLRWAADYYHHPIGEVLSHALPTHLREGRPVADDRVTVWTLTASGREQRLEQLAKRARQQARALELLARVDNMAEPDLRDAGIARHALARLLERGWIGRAEERPPATLPEAGRSQAPELTSEQSAALDAMAARGEGFAPFLLHGVTGSGKTEVFLRLVEGKLAEGLQTLLLVPEISLTPQLVARLKQRFGRELAVMHSALTASQRAAAWGRAYRREAHLIVGTRSAVFAPLPAAGLIVVDEEHDPAYKQEQGFRYSARDLAVMRARSLDVPIVLASATPSLESFRNAFDGRYGLLKMPTRIGSAGQPKVKVIDLNMHASRRALSTPLLTAIDEHLAHGNQVLLFLNRRGFAPALFCTKCQTVEECDRCDAKLTVHARSGRLRCHHCGKEKALRWGCETCGSERVAVGAGTQRVSDELQSLYPDRRIARLDRDITARSGALAEVLDDVEQGNIEIIVGTQMLTKGHDFPRVTLVGVLNADQGLFGTDLRCDERLAQTIVQVAGRAGRRDRPGEVLIQTHYPTHPLLASLLTQDYAAFAQRALAERRDANWPPYSHVAVWRAEATQRGAVFAFLHRVLRDMAAQRAAVELLGPAAAPMERRSGRFRAQLLLTAAERPQLHGVVARTLTTLRAWPETRKVRWAIDIDPNEL